MTIFLNGELRSIDRSMTILSLLEVVGVDPRLVAVEHNGTVIKRERYGDVLVNDGEEVEIVAFVGGG